MIAGGNYQAVYDRSLFEALKGFGAIVEVGGCNMISFEVLDRLSWLATQFIGDSGEMIDHVDETLFRVSRTVRP